MASHIDAVPAHPKNGDIVEGTVLGFSRRSLYIDLPPFGTGIIYGREYVNARDIIKNANVGDTVSAKVVDAFGMQGYIELSLREAHQALVWNEAEEAIKKKTVFELVVKEANKGGCIVEWQGIMGFLPASQLTGDHYPRVADGDKDAILNELRKLVGVKLNLHMLSASPKEGKLIFSEKTGGSEKEKGVMVEKYTVGDVVEGTVTGIVEFGIFLKIEEGLEGLVHISEIDWGLVDDPKTLFKVGDKHKVKIIEIKDGKVSLSLKALKENPWKDAADKYKKGQIVDGVVIKFNKHGALASVEEGVAGLVHMSEFGSMEKLKEKIELGKTYKFTINVFDPKEQRMTLSFGQVEAK